LRVNTDKPEYEELKKKYIELYQLTTGQNYTLEAHMKLIDEIGALQNKVIE
jgi:hypothetical protein